MTKLFTATGALALALCATSFVPAAKADEWDKETKITVHEQVQIQGTVLEPGVYVMRLLDSTSDRRILEIFNADESKLETTILANSTYRLEPTGDTSFTFYEAAAGHIAALHTWFYPGDNSGLEFVSR